MNKQTLIAQLKVAIVAILVFTGAAYISAQWTNPTVAPTGGNVAVPLNESTNTQVKAGVLGVGGLAVTGGVTINDGTQGLNKVLTSDANGVASWQNNFPYAPIVCTRQQLGKRDAVVLNNQYPKIGQTLLFKFTAQDCGGVLPDDTYVGVLKGGIIHGGTSSISVLDAGESPLNYPNETGPGIYMWWLTGGGALGNHNLQAVYFKKNSTASVAAVVPTAVVAPVCTTGKFLMRTDGPGSSHVAYVSDELVGGWTVVHNNCSYASCFGSGNRYVNNTLIPGYQSQGKTITMTDPQWISAGRLYGGWNGGTFKRSFEVCS